MKKEKRILLSFGIYLFTFLFICFYGITHTLADTYTASQFTAQLYDNYAPTLNSVSTNLTNNSWRGTIPTMTANSAGAGWGISSPITLLSNHTYSLSIEITGSYSGTIILSTYNRIGVGTTLANAKSSYENNSNVNENYSRALNGTTLQFAFTPDINASYIVFAFATSISGSNQSFYIQNVIIDDLGTSGMSEAQITNALNNQTNSINNSITASENRMKAQIKETETNITNSITDSDVDNDEASSFFSGFESNTFGLTSIITAPINLINSIISSTCSEIPLQVPFLDNMTFNLPCMTTIYRQFFGDFLTVYQTITFGIVAYWVCVKIFAMVKDFKNPEKDEIEVLDL